MVKKLFLKLRKSKRFLLISLIFILLIASTSALLQSSVIKKPLSESFFQTTSQSVINSCQNESSWRDCYGEELSNINKKIRLPDTLKVLDQIKLIDKKARDCHLIAHWVSLSEVEKNSHNWIDIFDYVDQTTCNNGFVHGVLEGRSRVDPDFKINPPVIIDTCQQIDQKTSRRLGTTTGGSDDACAHIMGHVLLANQEGSIRKTVAICSELPDNLKVSCYQGVFMENITRDNLVIHGVSSELNFNEEEQDQLTTTCRRYDGEIEKSCWREMAHFFTIITKNDPQKSYDLCYSKDDPSSAKECYMHAINLNVLSSNYSKTNLADTCRNYFSNDDLLNSCISRTITPLLGSSVDFIDRAIDFCSFIPENAQHYCFSKIGEKLKSKVILDKRLIFCKTVPDQYKKLCYSE